MHRINALHRDVKASNVMLLEQDDDVMRVKLLDLGVVTRLDDPAITEVSVFVGGKRSAPVEQFLGGKRTVRSDIYSVGAVLFHCLNGREVYAWVGPETAIALAMRDHPEQVPRSARADPDEETFARFLDQCIAVSERERPPSAAVCRRRLEALLEGGDRKRAAWTG